MTAAHSPRTALVTGASGYIGGRLVPRLLEDGWAVRVLTRRSASLSGRPWLDRVEVGEGDVASADDMRSALSGVDVAYYLVHSMDQRPDFAERDRQAARTFAAAAAAADVGRIVYLSGLHPEGETLSPHLASRVEVGEVFLASGVPTAVFQAAVVIGDGSASFDMLRYLTCRLPAMVAPKWLNNRIQPIAIDDVVHVLAAAADLPREVNRAFDIGGPDVMTYREMIGRFATVTGQRRPFVVTVPVLTPRLASHWVGLVTPIPSGLAKPLVGSLVHEVVVGQDDTAGLIEPPPGGWTSFDTAVVRAMRDARPDTGPRDLALTTALTAACAVVGSLAAQPDSNWYRRLSRPRWEPPGPAFPVVWTALYADVALSTATALTSFSRAGREPERTALLRALGANLALNAAWSVIFWRRRKLGLATAEAFALTVSAADLARRVSKGSGAAGRALTPYAVWCGFASVLSGAIARRNRQSL
ncbi:MAG TPA: tryptophan-rich sensory protein [Dermatophilaceae bacterium]|nr:tryptophan-rich sensory protein [Dermatophilaceae bacterium]